MADRQHGSDTELSVRAIDISEHCKTSTLEESTKLSDLTGYKPAGKAEIHGGGLKGGKFTVSGVYDKSETTAPALAMKGRHGETMAIIRKLEGTGAGKPQESFNAVLEKFAQTAPHDDFITWSADFTVTGPVDDDPQV